MSLAAQRSIDGMRFGPHGSWRISTRTRSYILLVTLDIVLSGMEKTRTKFRCALRSLKLENVLVVLTSLYCRSGTDPHLFLVKWQGVLISVIVHMLRVPCGRICMPLLRMPCECSRT